MSGAYVPRWQLCYGPARCQQCGSLAESSWRLFTTPSLWTRCYCEPCAKALLEEPAR